MDLTPENIQRLSTWVNNEARLQDTTAYINPEICDYFNADLLMRCPACFDISRFPIIFPCGHLECHYCYACDFKIRARRRGGIFFTICPVCRAEVRPEDVLTASNEIEQHPNSKVSNFYNGLRVLCSNLGCNLYTSYSQLTQHEIYQCPKRDITCPAESCPYVGTPKSIISHTIICPLHQIYCHSCDSKWPVTVYGHNCIKALQAKFLIDKVQFNIVKHLSQYHIEEHDSVVLPLHKIFTRPDEDVLQTTLNVVRMSRGKLLFGRRIDIPKVEPEHLPAPPTNIRRGYDEVDSRSEENISESSFDYNNN